MRKIKINNNNKNRSFGKSLLWIFLSLLVVANVFLSIDSATSGAEISYLEEQERRLADENNYNSEQLFKSVSLKQVEQQAVGLGFDKPASVVYLNGEESVAKLP